MARSKKPAVSEPISPRESFKEFIKERLVIMTSRESSQSLHDITEHITPADKARRMQMLDTISRSWDQQVATWEGRHGQKLNPTFRVWTQAATLVDEILKEIANEKSERESEMSGPGKKL